MPALQRARGIGKRFLCSSNLHTAGIGLNVYMYEYQNRLPLMYDRWGPQTFTYSTDFLEPWVSYVMYHQDQADAAGKMQPVQMAALYEQNLIDNSKSFFCPAQPATGANLPFTHGYYTDNGRIEWGTWLPTKLNGSPDDKIRSSYHYWLYGKQSLSDLHNEPVVFDNIQHWNSVAHTQNGQPEGINALFGDGHVHFSKNPEQFELTLWNGGPDAGPWDGPGNDKSLFEQILTRLDL